MADLHVRIHPLKVDTAWFEALESGAKTFEVRRDDRGFQRGDILRLREWAAKDPDSILYADRTPTFTGRDLYCRITFILTGGQFGIAPGFVVMALETLSDDKLRETSNA